LHIIDISIGIKENMITYPGDAKFKTKPVCTIAHSGCNMTKLVLGTHTGTHIDAPFHFLSHGASIDKIPLSVFIGKTQVIEIEEDKITADNLKSKIKSDIKRILFKTKNSNLLKKNQFCKNYTYLTEDGAHFIAKKGIKLVGIDYISIDRFGTPDFSVHKILFEAQICILEGIYLAKVKPDYYTLIALPLKLNCLDGSPVRAVLIKE